MGQDYQTEVYPQPGSEPLDYPQNGFAQNDFAQSGFGQDPGVTQAYGTQPGYGQNDFVPSGPNAPGALNAPGVPGAPGMPNGQAAYTADGYGQGGFGVPGSRQDGYPQDPYTQDAYPQDPYTPAPYTQDPYGQGGFGQQGFEQPAGPGYDDDNGAALGRAPRSRPGPPRNGPGSSEQLAGARMALYLAAAVVGVIVIVFVVVQLTKSSPNKAAAGSSTPSTSTPAVAGAATNGYVITQAARVGSFPLNKTATREIASAAASVSSATAREFSAKGGGKLGKGTVAVYDLTGVKSFTSSAYRGIIFSGYDGTFNPTTLIKLVRSTLVSSRVVNAGPHGGDMVCGYDTSGGSDASQCVWVTKTTFGEVEFLKGQSTVKYPGASKLALEVRSAVEVHA